MKGVSEMKHRMHGRPVPDPDEIPEGIDLDDSERFRFNPDTVRFEWTYVYEMRVACKFQPRYGSI